MPLCALCCWVAPAYPSSRSEWHLVCTKEFTESNSKYFLFFLSISFSLKCSSFLFLSKINNHNLGVRVTAAHASHMGSSSIGFPYLVNTYYYSLILIKLIVIIIYFIRVIDFYYDLF